MKAMHLWGAVLGAVVAMASAHASDGAMRLPTEAFASLPVAQRASVSPDGQKVAMLANSGGTSAIVVREVGKPDGKTSVVMNTNNKDFTFSWLHWAGNERLLVAIRFPAKRRVNGMSSVSGVDTYETRLLSAKIDGSQNLNLTKPNSFKGTLQAQFQDQVIDFDVDGGKHVLLAMDDPYESLDPAVYSLDVETGARSMVQRPRQYFRSWMVDRAHRVRVGIRLERGDVEIHACDPDGSNWRKLWSYQVLGSGAVEPKGFGKDPNILYVVAEHEGRDALFTVDLRDPELKRTLKQSSSMFDISGSLVYSDVVGDVVGMATSDTNVQSELRYWHADKRALMASIDEALPRRFNRIVSTSDDETRYLVYSTSDRVGGEYYFGDLRTNALGLMASAYPQLPESAMVGKQAISVKARDGLTLPGYLSTPMGVKASGLPTVLLVHGGPYGHDDASFNILTQFLANRGYAVLQINSRGSNGFGSAMRNAGLQRWGQEMQDDLSDGLQWAVSEGVTDPKRVCIVGASYGGYAALMGVAKTPDTYRCAVSFAGVSDLLAFGADKGLYVSGKEVYEAAVGSLDTQADRLRQFSPRYQAKSIKVPVLLVHGTEDRSVSVYQGDYMDAALTEAGVPHKYIRLPRGDHGLSIHEHRMQFMSEVESFLAANLGSGATP